MAKTLPPCKTGWWTPNGRRWHFIGADYRSLCGKWAYIIGAGELEGGSDNHPENCKACQRKKAALAESPKNSEDPCAK